MKSILKNIGLLLMPITLALALGCEKTLPPNPYEGINEGPIDTTTVEEVDPNSLAGLHQNIFSPVCANSGCHDGTFEPDFRTIESAYNTLVYHPIIKNDTAGTFQYRVVPGNVEQSLIYARLTRDLVELNDMMPLETLNTDWPVKKDEYIQNIVNWIEAGAPDLFGNPSIRTNKKPQMLGNIAFQTGSMVPLNRTSNGIIKVPSGTTSLDIWFSLVDDSTATVNLLHNEVKFSLFMHDFNNAQTANLQIVSTPLVAEGYEGTGTVEYYHKVTINPYDYVLDSRNNIFMRIYVKDPQNEVVEIPSKYSENIFKTYFTMMFI